MVYIVTSINRSTYVLDLFLCINLFKHCINFGISLVDSLEYFILVPINLCILEQLRGCSKTFRFFSELHFQTSQVSIYVIVNIRITLYVVVT